MRSGSRVNTGRQAQKVCLAASLMSSSLLSTPHTGFNKILISVMTITMQTFAFALHSQCIMCITRCYAKHLVCVWWTQFDDWFVFWCCSAADGRRPVTFQLQQRDRLHIRCRVCVCARVWSPILFAFFLLISGPGLHLVPLISSHVFTGESKTWQRMEKKRARSNPLLFQKYQLVRRGDGIDGEKQS